MDFFTTDILQSLAIIAIAFSQILHSVLAHPRKSK